MDTPQFEHNAAVTVQLGAAGDLPGRVDHDDGEVLTLVVLPREGATVALPDEVGVTVEWTTRRGLHRMAGTAMRDPARPEVLRVRRDAVKVVQRRDAIRVEVVVRATVTVVDGEIPPFATNTLDLSITGLSLRDPAELAEGAVVDVDLAIAPDEPPVHVRGVVVRTPRPGVKSVRTDAITPQDRHRLTRLISERQRRELLVARERLDR